MQVINNYTPVLPSVDRLKSSLGVEKNSTDNSPTYGGFTVFMYVIFLGIFGTTTFFTYFSYASYLALLIISLFLFRIYRKYGSEFFSFVLLGCCFFNYTGAQGGLWNITAFGVYLLFLLTPGLPGRRSLGLFLSRQMIFGNLCVFFLLLNIAGYLFVNPFSVVSCLQGAFSLIGCIYALSVVSSIKINARTVKCFIEFLGFMSCYLLLVALNQRWELFPWNLPFFPSGHDQLGIVVMSNTATTTMSNSELFGESQLFCFIVFTLFLSIPRHMSQIMPNGKLLVLFWMVSILNIMLSGSRSVFMMMIGILVLMAFLLPLFLKGISIPWKIFLSTILLLLIIAGNLSVFNTDFIRERIMSTLDRGITLDAIVSGEATNRKVTYEAGLQRLSDRNWLLGFGWGGTESNVSAWRGRESDGSIWDLAVCDSHCLYLSVVPVFGWIGGIIFIFLLLSAWGRLAIAVFRNRHRHDITVVLGGGISIVGLAFFLNEYKINGLRDCNYFLLIWIIMGLALALTRHLNKLSDNAQGVD